MRYLRDHWRGLHPLRWAFWLNFFALGTMLHVFAWLIQGPFFTSPRAALVVALGYGVIGWLIIYPWQIVGLLRACDHYLRAWGDIVWVRAVHAAVLLSLIAAPVALFSMYQKLFAQAVAVEQAVSDRDDQDGASAYSLTLIKNETLIHLQGSLELGITRQLAALLDHRPQIEGIILDSDGGNIYAARGLARLIQDYHLDTYSLTGCKSACTTAFISGSVRTLSTQARLGFHQYRLLSTIPYLQIDPLAEQEKDRAFYARKHIKQAFLARIFDSPHESIWLPELDELLDAGVIHRVIDRIDDI